MSKDNAHLCAILKAAKAIRRFVEAVEKEQFIANEEKHEAVTASLRSSGRRAGA